MLHGSNVGKEGVKGSSKSVISCLNAPECLDDRSRQRCCCFEITTLLGQRKFHQRDMGQGWSDGE